MKSILYLLIIMSTILASCSKDNQQLQQAEMILPGTWKIESFQVPKYGLGVSYAGNTFYVDTILYNIGSITIPEFSADRVHASMNPASKVPCEVTIGSEVFPFSIHQFYPSEGGLAIYFQFNGPDGSFPITTPEESFIWSSYIFQTNYRIEILDSKNITLTRLSNEKHVIVLSKL